MFMINIAIIQKPVERCLFLKNLVVIIVNIIKNYLWEHSELFHCSYALLLWLLWWVKNLIWQVSERRKETGLACDVFVI